MQEEKQVKTQRENFLCMLGVLDRQMGLSDSAMMTILALCQTSQQMEAFAAWIMDHIPDEKNIPYDEIDLMCVANDVHKGVPIRTLKADK